MVSKTIELRKVVQSILKESDIKVYYENADIEASFPHIVYNLDSVNFGNLGRDDIILTIDIWDKNTNSTNIEIIADKIESKLSFNNKPTNTVLPTFFIESRSNIEDEDKSIRRRQLKATIQNYYIGG